MGQNTTDIWYYHFIKTSQCFAFTSKYCLPGWYVMLLTLQIVHIRNNTHNHIVICLHMYSFIIILNDSAVQSVSTSSKIWHHLPSLLKPLGNLLWERLYVAHYWAPLVVVSSSVASFDFSLLIRFFFFNSTFPAHFIGRTIANYNAKSINNHNHDHNDGSVFLILSNGQIRVSNRGQVAAWMAVKPVAERWCIEKRGTRIHTNTQ